MRSFKQIIYKLFYKPALELYLKTDSNIKFDGFKLKVFKGVFHPKLFFSSKYFYSFLSQQSLDQLTFLEIGCGSGILSLLAYKKGAVVTAIDIDEKAVENTKINFSKNFNSPQNVCVFQSNLFENLKNQSFDVVVINPPYYFKKIEIKSQYAWYCGENGEYFEDLFLNIADYMHIKTNVYMILEENCEIDKIKSIAFKNEMKLELIDERLIKWEKSYIFRLEQNIS